MKAILLSLLFLLVGTNLRAIAQESSEATHQKETAHRIALKELDDFHEMLHPLVHEAYPSKDYAAIRSAMPGLLKEGKKVAKAKLPKEFSGHKKEFTKHSRTLVAQLQALVKKNKTLTDEQYGEQFMEMHETFEAIADLLR